MYSYHNKAVCPVYTFKSYIKQTAKLRKSQKLFVSFKTFRAVTTSTIARWLKFVLSEAGIDISQFKAHSFRSASTSAASNAGVSLSDILKTANWSSASTFQRFYHKDIETHNTNYTNTDFSNNI